MIVLLVTFVCIIFIAVQWAEGIRYMKENHPDYKGKDFLQEE